MEYYENALVKKDELCEFLKDYTFSVHEKDEGEYKYLEPPYICITILNSRGEEEVYIDLTDEFTLSMGGAYHAHYDPDDESYQEMVSDLMDYLEGRICTAALYLHAGEKNMQWKSSTMIFAANASEKMTKQNFQWQFKDKHFRCDLKRYGGEVHYNFFEPEKNITVMLEKVEN